MSKNSAVVESPNVVIKRQHQSAPKQHWADKEVQKALDEYERGAATLVPGDDGDAMVEKLLGLNVGHTGNPDDSAPVDAKLMRLPRVIDAMRRLEAEMEQSHSQEFLEKSQQLYELTENAKKKEQWDGQGRWIGKDNEAMRIGQVLGPYQFLERLEKVIGKGKLFLPPIAVLCQTPLLTPIENEHTRLCDAWDLARLDRMYGEKAAPDKVSVVLPGGRVQRPAVNKVYKVGMLQYPCGSEWMVMKFDEYGVPTRPKYLGWRTALLSLIKNGILTEQQAHKAFPLDSGPAGAWYRAQLFALRSAVKVDNA